jgi:HD-GYP domain-containing protein (c-di-GMP phosphodiesterase class II)
MSDARGLSPAERALRERGCELVLRITAILRVARAYSVTNQVFHNQLGALAKTLQPLYKTGDEVVFVVFEGGLFLNGVRVPTSSGNFHHARALTKELERRGIAGFETRGEPTVEEWQAWFEVFLDPGVGPAAEFVDALAARGLPHLFAALHVSNVWPDVGLGGGAAAQGTGTGHDDSAGEGPKRGARGGRANSVVTAARGAAPKRYSSALLGLQSLLTGTTADDGLALRHAKRVVQPLIDGVEEGDPIVLGLVGMHRRDDYTYARLVNAVLIAVTIAQKIGLDRASMSDLAVATLLQGVGRDSTRDPVRWGVQGALQIARFTAFNRTTLRAMQVALESNRDYDDHSPRSVLAQIAAIATCYTRLVSARTEAGATVTPAQALGMVLGPYGHAFSPALRAALVQSLGFHPPGQGVELDDGALAVVVGPSTDLAHPIVRVIAGPGGRPLLPGEWEGGPLPEERAIVRDLTAEETPEFEAA